ncbi:MAG: hypothetical protein U1A77_05500 [Pirellulales bacterium]
MSRHWGNGRRNNSGWSVIGGALGAACRAFVLGGLLVAGTGLPAVAAPPNSTDPLDEELLKDLLPKLSTGGENKGRTAPPAPRDSTNSTGPPSQGTRQPTGSDRERADEKPRGPADSVPSQNSAADDEGGEDVQLGAQAALRSLKERMRGIEERLHQGDSTKETQATQAAIVAELDAMLARMGQRKGAAQPAASASSAGETKPPESPANRSPQGESGKPGDDETRVKAAAPEGDPMSLPGQAWGELPPQLRAQLRSLAPEKFLPGYEAMIEAYYRRLAEKRSP